MNGFALTAALVEALAWPIAAIVIALLFRKQVKALLAQPLSRLRAGPVEMEWKAKFAEVAPKVIRQTASPTTSDSVAREFAGLSESDPAAAIFRGFQHLEQALVEQVLPRLRDRVKAGELKVDGSGPSARRNHTEFARTAAREGVITQDAADAVAGLAVLRDLATARPADVSTSEAVEYLTMVDGVLFALSRPPRGADTPNPPPALPEDR